MQPDLSRSSYIPYFDGLRGFGALIVLMTHMGLSGLFPFGDLKPFQFFYNGSFAVDLFFALSGCVMAMLAHRSSESYAAISVRRYVRLALPATAACLLSALILLSGLYYNQKLAAFNGSTWLALWFNSHANLGMALREGMIRIFEHPVSAYDSSLWTMMFELWCSLVIFAGVYLLRFRWLCFTAAAIATYYVGLKYMIAPISFCIGAATYYLRYWFLDPVETSSRTVRTAVGTVATIIAAYGFYLGSYPGLSPDGVLYRWLLFTPGLSPWQWASAFGGPIIVLAIGWSPIFRWLFACRVMRYLGRISFAFYLLHLPILCSLGAWSYLVFRNAMVTFIITTGAILVCATLFERYIDRPSIRFSRWVSQWIDRHEQLRFGRSASPLHPEHEIQHKQPVIS